MIIYLALSFLGYDFLCEVFEESQPLFPSSLSVHRLIASLVLTRPYSFPPVRAVPVIEKRLMDVKLGELGTWLGGRDFTPNGLLASVRRGEETCYT